MTRDIKAIRLQEDIEKRIDGKFSREINRKKEETQKKKVMILTGVFLGLFVAVILMFFSRKIALSAISFFMIAGIFFVYIFLRDKLRESQKIRKAEDAFPDFLQLMSSNLRAGMTIDRAMLLSSRPEFAPLDEEILKVGKDIATGKNIEDSMLEMAKRIHSEKIEKTILLILSGMRAGGNLAVLLEETSINMRERGFVEKKAASNVLMYVIFIFVASCVGGPVLFSLSSILVETLVNLLSKMPSVPSASMSLPFTLSSVSISVNFILYFSVLFIIVTNVLGSLILGLVNKGEEKEGLRFLPFMLVISLLIFFVIRIALSGFVAGLFG